MDVMESFFIRPTQTIINNVFRQPSRPRTPSTHQRHLASRIPRRCRHRAIPVHGSYSVSEVLSTRPCIKFFIIIIYNFICRDFPWLGGECGRTGGRGAVCVYWRMATILLRSIYTAGKCSRHPTRMSDIKLNVVGHMKRENI